MVYGCFSGRNTRGRPSRTGLAASGRSDSGGGGSPGLPQCLQPRPPPQSPARPHALQVHLPSLDPRTRTVQDRPVTPYPGTEHLAYSLASSHAGPAHGSPLPVVFSSSQGGLDRTPTRSTPAFLTASTRGLAPGAGGCGHLGRMARPCRDVQPYHQRSRRMAPRPDRHYRPNPPFATPPHGMSTCRLTNTKAPCTQEYEVGAYAVATAAEPSIHGPPARARTPGSAADGRDGPG